MSLHGHDLRRSDRIKSQQPQPQVAATNTDSGSDNSQQRLRVGKYVAPHLRRQQQQNVSAQDALHSSFGDRKGTHGNLSTNSLPIVGQKDHSKLVSTNNDASDSISDNFGSDDGPLDLENISSFTGSVHSPLTINMSAEVDTNSLLPG